ALVLEKIPAGLAAQVTQALSIPTIGIGAGNQCDGQVLVINDMLGLTKGFRPKFLRQYLNLYEAINKAVEQYIEDVKSGSFPNENEQY
ncbi:MAG TPA: 3-methyl-2-oxobutanoate hydroxymethyltransferase, partial [Sphingobacteriaceae bacterium]|nr:3-methyl-2-oxobutanoate hydroxymethyltransferase [Sphingobacteriaceae bacterium]